MEKKNKKWQAHSYRAIPKYSSRNISSTPDGDHQIRTDVFQDLIRRDLAQFMDLRYKSLVERMLISLWVTFIFGLITFRMRRITTTRSEWNDSKSRGCLYLVVSDIDLVRHVDDSVSRNHTRLTRYIEYEKGYQELLAVD